MKHDEGTSREILEGKRTSGEVLGKQGHLGIYGKRNKREGGGLKIKKRGNPCKEKKESEVNGA